MLWMKNWAGAVRKPNSVPVAGYPPTGDDHSSADAGCPAPLAIYPGASDGPPSNAPLFDLAPGGVCQASPVARGTGALLPHHFTLTPPVHGEPARRYPFCCTFLRVTTTPRYGAPCPMVFGLSSGMHQRSSGPLRPKFG